MAWQLLRENSPRGEFARRRVAVLTAAVLFLGGLLVAIGLGRVVEVAVILAAVGAAGFAAVHVLRRPGRLPRPDLAPVRRHAKRGAVRARDLGTRVARDVQPAVSGFVERATTKARSTDWHGWPYAGAASPVAPPEAQHRRAVELNARGAQLRSEGRPDQAAEQHRQALAIFRRLGDRKGEAPTLNSLALALEAAGDTDAAVERFEQAITILHNDGDELHEGRVIANLGFTMLRHGEDDQARRLLETALDKLDPESRTAQQVVEQLRRAS
ncbi:MAG TPA: tetratricopeptide repeat protein [Gaiellaceae bacterium]